VTSAYFEAPTHIVMHPRRAAFLASGQSTSTPIFQQGGLMMASGEQDAGVVGTIAGLPVVVDARVAAGSVWIESGHGATAPLGAARVSVVAA
jgi:hypothetical protein